MDDDGIMKESQEDFTYIYINSKKYKKIKELGNGAFGAVYLVFNESENKNYAIKQIPIENKNENEINSIENEVKILSKIGNDNNDNNHIIKYYDSCKDKRHFNILMEYCGDKNLKKFINEYKEKKEFIDENIIYNFILDICLGIKTIHKNKIIHRDLKPENLFLTKDNRIKIGDFGISKQLTTINQYANSMVGTSNYMAPEILKNNYYNYKVDIWAFGCIIYELLTLKVCFVGQSALYNKITELKLGTINTKIYNSKWRALVGSLLKKNYLERPSIDVIYTQIKEDIRISDLKGNKMKRISEKDFKNKISEKMEKRQIYRMKCN